MPADKPMTWAVTLSLLSHAEKVALIRALWQRLDLAERRTYADSGRRRQFSLITVWADSLARDTTTAIRPNAAAWYRKQERTFSDAITAVRRVLWCPPNFSMSRQIGKIIEIPTSLLTKPSLPDSMPRSLN
jgi:hypothetical protein